MKLQDRVKLGERARRLFQGRARHYLKHPQEGQALLERAQAKAQGRADQSLGSVRESFFGMLRLIRAYLQGRYTDLPWRTVMTAMVAVVYFVVPTDIVPDWIAGLGLFDDVAVLSWAIHAIRTDYAAFRAWETGDPQTPAEPADGEPATGPASEPGRSTEFG